MVAVKSEKNVQPTDVGVGSDVDSEIESDFDAASEQPSIESDIEHDASGGDDYNGQFSPSRILNYTYLLSWLSR